MKFVKKFEKDEFGIYIFPLLGYSNIDGNKSLWFGFYQWLWIWEIKKEIKDDI